MIRKLILHALRAYLRVCVVDISQGFWGQQLSPRTPGPADCSERAGGNGAAHLAKTGQARSVLALYAPDASQGLDRTMLMVHLQVLLFGLEASVGNDCEHLKTKRRDEATQEVTSNTE